MEPLHETVIVRMARDYVDEDVSEHSYRYLSIGELIVNAFIAGYQKCENDNREDDE